MFEIITLTHEEVAAAADIFFPLFNEVHSRMPDGSTTEDTLKVMKNVVELGHKTRVKELNKKIGRPVYCDIV